MTLSAYARTDASGHSGQVLKMVLGETTAVEKFPRKVGSHHNTSPLLSDFSKNVFVFII